MVWLPALCVTYHSYAPDMFRHMLTYSWYWLCQVPLISYISSWLAPNRLCIAHAHTSCPRYSHLTRIHGTQQVRDRAPKLYKLADLNMSLYWFTRLQIYFTSQLSALYSANTCREQWHLIFIKSIHWKIPTPPDQMVGSSSVTFPLTSFLQAVSFYND